MEEQKRRKALVTLKMKDFNKIKEARPQMRNLMTLLKKIFELV